MSVGCDVVSHRLRRLLPQPGRPLHVGEQERHGPMRRCAHDLRVLEARRPGVGTMKRYRCRSPPRQTSATTDQAVCHSKLRCPPISAQDAPRPKETSSSSPELDAADRSPFGADSLRGARKFAPPTPHEMGPRHRPTAIDVIRSRRHLVELPTEKLQMLTDPQSRLARKSNATAPSCATRGIG